MDEPYIETVFIAILKWFIFRNFSRKSSATKTFTSGQRASDTDDSAMTALTTNADVSPATSSVDTWPRELPSRSMLTLTRARPPSMDSSRPLRASSRLHRNRSTIWWNSTASAGSSNRTSTRRASWRKWAGSRFDSNPPDRKLIRI